MPDSDCGQVLSSGVSDDHVTWRKSDAGCCHFNRCWHGISYERRTAHLLTTASSNNRAMPLVLFPSTTCGSPRAAYRKSARKDWTQNFFLTIPLANWLAGVFSRAGIDNLERQTARLKQHREKLKKKRRDRMISSSTAPHRYTDEPGKGLKMVHTPTRPHTPPAVRLLPGCTYIFMEVKFNAMATFLWLPRGSHSSGGVA